jgi:hypothetical protein
MSRGLNTTRQKANAQRKNVSYYLLQNSSDYLLLQPNFM